MPATPGPSPSRDARLLVALADAADAITVPAQGDAGAVRRKADDSPVTEVDRAVEAALRARVDALAAQAWHAGGYESFLGPVMVAEGAIDAALLPEVEPWDVVPLQAVVEAAGGRVTLLDCGAPRIGALFTNHRLHERVLDTVRG